MNQYNRSNHAAASAASLSVLVGLALGCDAVRAQGGQDPVMQQPPQQSGSVPGVIQPTQQTPLPSQMLNMGGFQGGRQGGIDEFTSIWSRPTPPQFSGFPVFPSNLPGYGSYPLPANQATGTSPGQMALVLPPAAAGPAGWPAWVRAQSKRPLPFRMDAGLLVGQEGRVWHSDAEGEAFVPIRYHDKFAALTSGATVETRGAGAFELLLEATTRVETRGVTAMKTLELDEKTVHLQFDKLTWLRITCTSRTNLFTLPDGSVLELTPDVPAADPAAGGQGGLAQLFGLAVGPTPQQPPLVEVRRVDEPSWYGGRATITNFGGGDVLWKHAFGETTISPRQRVTFFLSPPKEAVAAALTTPNARVTFDGETATCEGAKATQVGWLGARIDLQAGQAVKFETLGGSFAALVGGALPGEGAGQ